MLALGGTMGSSRVLCPMLYPGKGEKPAESWHKGELWKVAPAAEAELEGSLPQP